MSSQDRVRRSLRARARKPILDLNSVPSCESQGQEGTSNGSRSLVGQAGPEVVARPPAPIDVEAIDDDVVISSPRAFAEAKNNARRRGRAVIVDVESGDGRSGSKRIRIPSNQTIISCDLHITVEGSSGSARTVPPPPPPPPSPRKEPTFSCPVCMGPLVEETSTKCGHIFCKACIKAAISAQAKCPTCRRKTTAKDIIRIYLPATSSA